jgi:flagellar basal-body rod protein FlgF
VDSGFYAACTGLIAKTKALDNVAHNLANVSTTGFKKQQVTFQSLLAASNPALSPVNQAINNFGVVGSPTIDRSQGSIEQTGNDLDVAIEGPGYLVAQTPAGIGYTRSGNLHLSRTRELLSSAGNPVLGDQGPITLPMGTSVRISPQGMISVDGAVAGALRLVEFDPQAPMTETAPGLYRSPAAARVAVGSSVRQGALESANINPVEAAVGLVTVQREAEMLQRALTMFHGEMNRIATTELSRV